MTCSTPCPELSMRRIYKQNSFINFRGSLKEKEIAPPLLLCGSIYWNQSREWVLMILSTLRLEANGNMCG